MHRLIGFFLTAGITFFATVPGFAHFGMLIPSDSMVMQHDNRIIRLALSFSHPFESIGMVLERPKTVGVVENGRHKDLGLGLKQIQVMGKPAWQLDYRIKRPGAYLFYMEPQPYWEAAEDCYIIHYTKTVVAAFGDDEGWNREVGLPAEIVPLSRPFGLYTGNVFQGVVKMNGRPVPGCAIEVEYYNRNQKAKAPTDYMVAQTIQCDPNGVFTYAAPRSGWWGFAALNTADYQMKHNDVDKAVELGAVIWVRFHDWKE